MSRPYNDICMESLIQTFHIDWKLILAQVINFIIVVLVLWRLAYKPLLKAMNERTQKIEGGLKNAQEAERRLLKIEKEKEKVFRDARFETEKILAEAKTRAKEIEEESKIKTRDEVGKIVFQGKEELRREREKVFKEIKGEVSELVLALAEKVLQEKIDKKEHEHLLKQALHSLSKK